MRRKIGLQNKLLQIILVQFVCFQLAAQQVPDTVFNFKIDQATYQPHTGPEIWIDAAHNNFHTKDGRFYPFAKLVGNDGYKVKGLNQRINSLNNLKGCKILVIANALDETNLNRWILPNPSAFSPKEIEIINEWVKSGGSLLLIADHMPFAGAAFDLAKSFGFDFQNGFAKTSNAFWPPAIFRKDSLLLNCIVTTKSAKIKQIDSVATFTGSAFKIPRDAIGVLKFNESHKGLAPDTAWNFNGNTPTVNLRDYYQGAILNYSAGKIAVFGEAAMFTAQTVNNTTKVGINSVYAPQNPWFILNLIHWLDAR